VQVEAQHKGLEARAGFEAMADDEVWGDDNNFVLFSDRLSEWLEIAGQRAIEHAGLAFTAELFEAPGYFIWAGTEFS
jgi:hypothetical protein